MKKKNFKVAFPLTILIILIIIKIRVFKSFVFIPGLELSAFIAFCILTIVLFSAQLVLSINYKNWINELGSLYSQLEYEERLKQVKDTFWNLKEVEAEELRRFYIFIHSLHYFVFISFALTSITMFLGGIYLAINAPTYKESGIFLFLAFSTLVAGYHIGELIFSLKERKSRTNYSIFSKTRTGKKN